MPSTSSPAVAESSTIAAKPAPAPELSREEVAPTGGGSDTDMPEMLEQLRDLGELRDAGYVTDAEFETIKQRILGGGR